MVDPQRVGEVDPLKRRLLALAVSLALAVTAAEGWARLQERSIRLVGDGRLYTEWPGEHGSNSQGFHEREVGPSSKRRIAVLGDSMTWGTGTAEQTWTHQAELVLGDTWEVLNFATYGYDTAQERATIPQALATKPEFLVVAVYVNDVFPTRVVELAGRPVFVGRGRAPSALLRLLQGAQQARRKAEEDWGTFERELAAISTDAPGVAVVFVGLRPHVLNGGVAGCRKETDDAKWCRDQTRIADHQRVVARRLGLQWIDLVEPLQEAGATAFWPEGHTDREHPNPEGAALLGRVFATAWKARVDRPVSSP